MPSVVYERGEKLDGKTIGQVRGREGCRGHGTACMAQPFTASEEGIFGVGWVNSSPVKGRCQSYFFQGEGDVEDCAELPVKPAEDRALRELLCALATDRL